MKNFAIAILSILLIGSVVLNVAIVKRNEIPDKMIVQNGYVETVENEGEGKFRYEIVTEDGNAWVIFGDGYEKVGDELVVVFYTFNSTDVTTWDIIEYWVVGR